MFLLCRAGVLRSVSRRLSSRFLATRTRAAWERTAETVKSDSISGVASQSWGRALVAGGCFAGIGGLCFYGLGFAPEAGAVDRAMFWPPVVKERIQKTYTYFTGGLAVTAAAAAATVRSGVVARLSRLSPFAFLLIGLGGSLGSYMLCVSVPYENTLMKHSAWLLFSGAWGMFLAPAVMMGGALVARAAVYTAGTVAGLTATAACAPSDKFLTWAGPLSLGLGAVCVASLGSMFLGPMSSLGLGMYSFSLYGGLLVFGGFMLYDTQKIIKAAETQPQYDPVNESLGIYMDAINIFIRILMILSSSSSRKK